MAAHRFGAVRTRHQRPVGSKPVARHAARNMAPVGSHAIAARGNALDQPTVCHSIP
jgi:hypothetical protein